MELRARSESPMLENYRPPLSTTPEPYCPLFSANNARRRAEQDSILLANRIRLLRAEDERAKKRIRETEQKTKEIIELRRRGEEKRLAKEEDELRREAFEQELRAKAARERQEQQRKLQMAQREILGQKATSSASVKQERELHKVAIESEKRESAAEVAARAAQVRKELVDGERRRARSEGLRREAGRAYFHEKLAREEAGHQESLAQIRKMENEEAELIQKLQRSNERHRVAFTQLEDAIGGSSAPSRSLSALEGPLDHVHISTPTAASRAAAGPVSISGGVTETRGSRPPRPRNIPTPLPAPVSLTTSRAGAAGSVAGGARPTSASRVRPRSAPRAASEPRLNTLSERCQRDVSKSRGNSATSICSTATGGPNHESTDSGRSTPCSVAPAPITYTTMDGTQIDIPAEEELDLDKLLSGN